MEKNKMNNKMRVINLEEAMIMLDKNKDEITELKSLLNTKEEEINKLNTIIAEMKMQKSEKDFYQESAFDGLFESYDYYKQDK